MRRSNVASITIQWLTHADDLEGHFGVVVRVGDVGAFHVLAAGAACNGEEEDHGMQPGHLRPRQDFTSLHLKPWLKVKALCRDLCGVTVFDNPASGGPDHRSVDGVRLAAGEAPSLIQR